MTEHAEVVHLPGQVPQRRAAADLATEADQIREIQRAVLKEGTDFGNIPGTPKPTLFKAGAEWLLKWARFGHRFEVVETERDEQGRRYGVTYRCTVHALDDPSVIIATCDGYCGYDEPDREEHTSRRGKQVPRSPWNTIIKMAQKRALVGATLQATGTSGLFTQDLDDSPPDRSEGSAGAIETTAAASHEPGAPAPQPAPCRSCGRPTRRKSASGEPLCDRCRAAT